MHGCCAVCVCRQHAAVVDWSMEHLHEQALVSCLPQAKHGCSMLSFFRAQAL